MVKTGIGYDVHRFKKGGSLLLGGVTISNSIGVIAHSDGDVLLHAMVDALLGAAALGDLGKYFPSSDVQWKEKSSLFFLKYTSTISENPSQKFSSLIGKSFNTSVFMNSNRCGLILIFFLSIIFVKN